MTEKHSRVYSFTGSPCISAEQEAESSAGSKVSHNPKSHLSVPYFFHQVPMPQGLTNCRTARLPGDQVSKERGTVTTKPRHRMKMCHCKLPTLQPGTKKELKSAGSHSPLKGNPPKSKDLSESSHDFTGLRSRRSFRIL